MLSQAIPIHALSHLGRPCPRKQDTPRKAGRNQAHKDHAHKGNTYKDQVHKDISIFYWFVEFLVSFMSRDIFISLLCDLIWRAFLVTYNMALNINNVYSFLRKNPTYTAFYVINIKKFPPHALFKTYTFINFWENLPPARLLHTVRWNTIFSHIYLLVRYISLKF